MGRPERESWRLGDRSAEMVFPAILTLLGAVSAALNKGAEFEKSVSSAYQRVRKIGLLRQPTRHATHTLSPDLHTGLNNGAHGPHRRCATNTHILFTAIDLDDSGIVTSCEVDIHS